MCYSKVKMGIALIISLSITPAPGLAEALSPDPSFGSGGKVVTDFLGRGFSGFGDGAHAVVVQPDGKLVVAGFATPSNAQLRIQIALARYNLDGTLDQSFGRKGQVSRKPRNGFALERASAIAMQPNGKFVVASDDRNDKGTSGSVIGANGSFVLSRYKRNGALDKGFGHNGRVSTRFRGSAGGACTVVLQPDGGIVAAGRAGDEGSGDFALVRYKKNGRLDKGFGVRGRVTTDLFGNRDQLRAIALQPDGKIVATGYALTPPDPRGSIGPITVLVRYNPDGSLDEGFGTGGKVATDILFNFHPPFSPWTSRERFDCDPHDLVLQPDGRIVVGGPTMLVRFNADGTLDESFGSGGKVTTHPAHALAL